MLSVFVLLLACFNDVKAGCGYLPGGFTVTGDYTYDTASSTYLFAEGDTLLVTYNGTGNGTGYLEDYYFDGIFIGSRIDTFEVCKNGMLQVKQGCLNSADHTFDCKFAYSLTSTLDRSNIKDIVTHMYFDTGNNSICLWIESGSANAFSVKVYSITGQAVSEKGNMVSGVMYSLECIPSTLNIIQISDNEGQVSIKKVFIP